MLYRKVSWRICSHFLILVSLFMGSLSLQTIVNTWQHFIYFFKACTEGYIVNSCLTFPLNTDIVKQWAIQQRAALTFYEHLGMRLCLYYCTKNIILSYLCRYSLKLSQRLPLSVWAAEYLAVWLLSRYTENTDIIFGFCSHVPNTNRLVQSIIHNHCGIGCFCFTLWWENIVDWTTQPNF